MTPLEYRELWTKEGDLLLGFDRKRLNELNLSQSSMSYLEEGSPADAAPYLSFVKDSDDAFNRIAFVREVYEVVYNCDHLVIIAHDGNGNPLVVDNDNDSVTWLDHESDFLASYCNDSLKAFLTFILIYRDFVNDVIYTNGEEAFMDCNFSDEQFYTLKEKMLFVDNKAVKEGFWMEELEMLLTNRQYYQSNL